MEEVERLCDRVIIIDKGRVIIDDTSRTLRKRQASANVITIEVDVDAGGTWLDSIRALPGVIGAEFTGTKLRVSTIDLQEAAPSVLKCLSEAGCQYANFESERASLESLFLSLTGRSLRDS
jgi:ABC-2 type transport system ATP-binding protein